MAFIQICHLQYPNNDNDRDRHTTNIHAQKKLSYTSNKFKFQKVINYTCHLCVIYLNETVVTAYQMIIKPKLNIIFITRLV